MGELQRSPTLTQITMRSQNPTKETVRRQGMTGELNNREGLSRGERDTPSTLPWPASFFRLQPCSTKDKTLGSRSWMP